MSIVRVGTTQKYADGWDAIFGGRKRSAAKRPAAKKSTKKAKTRKKR